MIRGRAAGALYFASLVLALLLSLIALPALIAPLKPFFLALIVVYWCLDRPNGWASAAPSCSAWSATWSAAR